MALENVDLVGDGVEAPKGKIMTVGPRGGMKYDSALSGVKPTDNNQLPPTYIIVGPGIDMAFFRKKDGFDVRYNGPYCEDAIDYANELIESGSKFKEMIDELCKEFNCKIQNEDY